MTPMLLLIVAGSLAMWPSGSRAAFRLSGATGGSRPAGESARGSASTSVAETVRAWAGALPAPVGPALARLARPRPSRACAADAWLVDLLAALFAAGLDPAAALRAAGAASGAGHSPSSGSRTPSPGAETAQAFATAAAALAAGADLRRAWGPEEARSEVVNKVVAALERTASSGGAVRESLRRVADWARTQEAARRQAAAERAGVLVAGPLGACFLPAFVCVGVVPVVAGLAGQILPEVLG